MNLFRRARGRAECSEPFDTHAFAELEQRVMLSTLFGPALPDLSAMENQDNVIVRFQTNVRTARGTSTSSSSSLRTATPSRQWTTS